VKTSFRDYSRAPWRPEGVVTLGPVPNPQAVLLLAACRRRKPDRLLAVGRGLHVVPASQAGAKGIELAGG